jgi:hypothetical protein
MIRYALLAIICLATWAAGPAFGELYFWTDEDGIRHYTNHAPPSGGIDYGSSSEIDYDAEADRARSASDAKAAGRMKKERKAEEAEARRKEAEAARKAPAEERERLEAEKRAVEEKLYKKRRATRSRSQKQIQKVVEIDQKIEALEKSGGSPEEIGALKAQRRAIVEGFYDRSRYWKRGGQADLKEHKEIEQQLKKLDQEEKHEKQ